MQATERLGASSRCYVAPVGTPLSDSWEQGGWKEIGYTNGFSFDESHEFMQPDLLAHQDRLNRALHDYGMPSRWAIGVSGPHWWPQGLELPSNSSTINERSKPVGLTKEHIYTDRDGDYVGIEVAGTEGALSAIAVNDENRVWVQPDFAVPLALNVLGYDRPTLGEHQGTAAGSWYAAGVPVRSDEHRDELLAQAAANLRAIDLYDQHVAKKKADEAADEVAAAKAAEIAAAKARVEVANREIAERHFRKAKAAYQDALIDAYRGETTPELAAKLQVALSAYETARRKVEGLPS